MEHPERVQPEGTLGVDSDGEGGVVLRALGLWLDPPTARPAAFVSHAHAMKGLESSRAFASPETLCIARALGKAPDEAQAIGWDSAVELPVTREYGGGTARLSIAHAGHMLGAAQLVIDHPRGRFVYTGDWSGAGDASHPAGVVVACDELAVTSTFALPIFRFEPLGPALDGLLAWCRAQLAAGIPPIVLAQTPGAAQAILLAMFEHEMAAAAPGDVLEACRVYESCGVSFGELREYGSGPAEAVVVASARTRRGDLRRERGSTRASIAYASGWAVLDAMVEQKRADAAFVVADQADSDTLLALVASTGARFVHATHGDARTLAQLLRRRGFETVRAYEAQRIDERSAS